MTILLRQLADSGLVMLPKLNCFGKVEMKLKLIKLKRSEGA